MQFENESIENLVFNSKDFAVEGSNIFAISKENLFYRISTCLDDN